MGRLQEEGPNGFFAVKMVNMSAKSFARLVCLLIAAHAVALSANGADMNSPFNAWRKEMDQSEPRGPFRDY